MQTETTLEDEEDDSLLDEEFKGGDNLLEI